MRNPKKKSAARKQPKPRMNARKTTLALSIPTLLLGQISMVQADEAIVLDTMQIEERTIDTNPYAEKGAPYKAKISGDSRYVKELADTPQTINVLTQTAIKESGKTDLRDILAAQPGITLGTGENGNAFGDRYIIRGHEARSDVFVDGLRDPGMTTRESFAVEQIEITKGPSSTFAGRGSTGGAINGITKQASSEYDFNKVEVGLGTDEYRRITIDSNMKITDDLAVRINALYSEKDIPDREPADKERTGIAISGSYQATDQLNFIADYYYLNAEDSPDLGSYHLTNSTIAKNIPTYVQDQDFLKSKVNVATFKLGYDVSDTLKIENTLRYGTTDNGYVTTGGLGTTRDAADDFPGVATIRLDTHQGWQDVEYFVNRFNVFMDIGDKHQFVLGAEYSDIDVVNGVYTVTNTAATNCITGGRGGPSGQYCVLDGNGNEVSNIGNIMGRNITKGDKDSDYSVKTISLTVMDTITFNDNWSLFLGLRVDDFDYSNSFNQFSFGPGGFVITPVSYSYSDTLWNGHIGAVYSINDDANVYLTYSTSSNINGGESDVGGSCGYGGLCGSSTQQVNDSKPEQTENIELGAKWNVLNDKLLLTIAMFQITKDDVMESVGSDYAALGSLNTGKNRVEGVEISAVGNLTDKLSIQFGAAVMDSEILESSATGFGGGTVEFKGKPLSNFADDSAYLQLRYQATSQFSFGAVASYSSKMFVGQPDSPAGNFEIPSYTVYDLFASYAVNEQLNLRLNVGNVTDTDYYQAGYRNGAFVYIGDARNAQATLSYEF